MNMPVGPCVPVAPGGTPDDAINKPGAAPKLVLASGGPGPGNDSGQGPSVRQHIDRIGGHFMVRPNKLTEDCVGCEAGGTVACLNQCLRRKYNSQSKTSKCRM